MSGLTRGQRELVGEMVAAAVEAELYVDREHRRALLTASGQRQLQWRDSTEMLLLLEGDLQSLARQSLARQSPTGQPSERDDDPLGAWLDAAIRLATTRADVGAERLRTLREAWSRARAEQAASPGARRSGRLGALLAGVAVAALIGLGVTWSVRGGCRAPAQVEPTQRLRFEGVGELSLQPPGRRVTAVDMPGAPRTPVEAIEILALSDQGRGSGVAATLHARRGPGQQSLTVSPERGVIEVRARGPAGRAGWTVAAGEAIELVIEGLEPVRLLAHVPAALERAEVEGACWAGADDMRGLRVALRDGAFELSR